MSQVVFSFVLLFSYVLALPASALLSDSDADLTRQR